MGTRRSPATGRRGDARRPSPRLGYFVVASLLLHGLVLTLWRGEPPAGPAGRSTFQITLLARHGDTSGKAVAEAGKPEHSAGDRSGKRAESTNEVSAISAPAGRKPRQVAELTTDLRAVSSAALESQRRTTRIHAIGVKKPPDRSAEEKPSPAADQRPASPHGITVARAGSNTHGHQQLSSSARYHRVRAALQEALLPRFDYPSVARRRGWQGRVRIALHVEADGDLTDIHLLESSGYPLLDRAAVKNVTELRTVPAVSQWLGGHDMDVILPVRYQLQNR